MCTVPGSVVRPCSILALAAIATLFAPSLPSSLTYLYLSVGPLADDDDAVGTARRDSDDIHGTGANERPELIY